MDIRNDFEGTEVAVCWQAGEGGGLQLSSRHFKDGRQALLWTWTNGGSLMREVVLQRMGRRFP